MSFYGGGQAGTPVVPSQAQMVRAAGSLQPQMFGQLQFPQGNQGNPLAFDQNNHILLQGSQGFQNINVSFLSEQLAAAGVGQMISQATSNASQNMPSISMQNLMSPMAMTSLNFSSVPVANPSQQPGGSAQKQRVFTGTVTKAHENFGFIDDEVFFTTAAVKGPILPKAGDRVLVEAEYNGSAAFKWTATRIQIVNIGGGVGNMPLNMNSGKPNSQNTTQTSYQSTVSVGDKQTQSTRGIQSHLVAPPPPIISLTSQSGGSSRHTTSTASDGMNYSHVSIISNPHSVYTHSTTNPTNSSPGPTTSVYSQQQQRSLQSQSTPRTRVVMPMGDGLIPIQFPHTQQLPSLFPQDVSSVGTMEIMRKTERELERMGREREKERTKEKEKVRDRERERVRRRSPSPAPKKAKTDQWQERQLSRSEREKEKKDKSKDEERSRDTERAPRNPSPSTSSSRKRSRSRSKSRPRGSRRESPTRLSRRELRDKSPRTRAKSNSRSRSPSQIPPPRYNVQVPQFPLDLMELNVMDLKRRYQRMYIPSDFFLARACWLETFPLDRPFDLVKASPVLVFRRHAEHIDLGFVNFDPLTQNISKRKVEVGEEPEDSRRLFSAKVMLFSSLGEPMIYSNNLRRVVNFVVGMKMGKSELQGIGGPWSSSLDGPNPQSDPKVLIRTAIRTTKVSTGIDLTNCKKWFRFMELYYKRSSGVLETVVFFIPDLSFSIPCVDDWARIGQAYRFALGDFTPLPSNDQPGKTKEIREVMLSTKEKEKEVILETEETVEKEEKVEEKEEESLRQKEEKVIGEVKLEAVDEKEVPDVPVVLLLDHLKTEITYEVENECDKSLIIEEKSDAVPLTTPIEPKQMNVAKLKEELSIRGLSTKGLKAQLLTRLLEAVETEKETKALEVPDEQTEGVIEESCKEDEMVKIVSDPEIKMEGDEPKREEFDEGMEEGKEERRSEEVSTVEEPLMKENEEVIEEGVVKERELEKSIWYGDILVPLVPDEADEKTKETWKRRYTLPKTPHLIVHPLPSGKTKNLDCSKMSLASLREYRVHDVKEQSFEVSLFSEFFHEMIQRDFAFLIYKEASIRTHLSSLANDNITEKTCKENEKIPDNKGKEKEEKEKKESSENRKSSRRPSDASSIGGDSKNSSRSALSIKPKVINKELELAFNYYDTSKCGYIKETEFEEICLISGLKLTRAQVRKITQIIYEKESQFRYNLWTSNSLSPLHQELPGGVQKLAAGNKYLLPVFVFGEGVGSGKGDSPTTSSDSLLVPVDGNFIDIRKLMEQNEKYDAEQTLLEANINALTNNMNDAKVQVTELRKSSETWKSEYLHLKDSAKTTDGVIKKQTEDLETFRRASERFYDRIKGLIRKDKEETTNVSPLPSKRDSFGQDKE